MNKTWLRIVLVVAAATGIAVHVESAREPVRHAEQGAPSRATPAPRMTKEEFEKLMKELSNWGRWGKDDQLGTVNLITPEKRKQAARLVKEGISLSLAPLVPVGKIGQGGPGPKFIGPSAESSTIDVNFASDTTINGQGRSTWVHEQNYSLPSTHHGPHFDALCHVAFDGKTYNGYTLTQIASKTGGCNKLAIGGIRDKIVTRGILVDIAAMKGVKQLAPGTYIRTEDIEAFEKWAKVKFEPGDLFLYRLGGSKDSGLDASMVRFLKQRDIALLGGETAHETFNVPGLPVAIHSLIMVALGMNMFDNLDLEMLAETAARLKRWEFMFVAAPTPQTNGTGSQINPIAIF
jgi:hypothetical protein